MGSCDACDKKCNASEKQPNETDEQYRLRQAVAQRMCRIKRKYIVLSGKGGVGKSTVAANLAMTLASRGQKVGVLDVDFHGPSIPRLFGLDGAVPGGGPEGIEPVPYGAVKVMSIGFMLQKPEDAVIWRGPMKYSAIRQFLGEVNWGDLDCLIIDSPPGTGDEPLSVVQVIGNADGGIIVTTPQQVAINDVRRSVSFCRQVDLPVIGVIENMSGFACPHCKTVTPIFSEGGGEALAREMQVPFLGRVPIEPEIVRACDNGTPYIEAFRDSVTAGVFNTIAAELIGKVNG